MTLSETNPGSTQETGVLRVEMQVLQKRREFLAASRAKRQVMPGFIVQARKRGAEEGAAGLLRVGYTCSKKVGNAVARNRAKRRLREVARAVLPDQGQPGWDYVLIGRANVTAALPFTDLVAQLSTALGRFHGPRDK